MYWKCFFFFFSSNVSKDLKSHGDALIHASIIYMQCNEFKITFLNVSNRNVIESFSKFIYYCTGYTNSM